MEEEKNINNDKNKKINKEKSQIKKEEKPILLNTKKELEEKISNLKQDYFNLENKSNEQLEEEFFINLEVDDSSLFRKKMVGYVQPFFTRGKDTRNPEKNVKQKNKIDIIYENPIQKDKNKENRYRNMFKDSDDNILPSLNKKNNNNKINI